jgi:hypothetical protein
MRFTAGSGITVTVEEARTLLGAHLFLPANIRLYNSPQQRRTSMRIILTSGHSTSTIYRLPRLSCLHLILIDTPHLLKSL